MRIDLENTGGKPFSKKWSIKCTLASGNKHLMDNKQLTLKFWGARGSMIPFTPGIAFGVHSTCVEIESGGGHSLFIDMGSGVVPGINAALERGVRHFTILMTHLHSDHLNGVFGCAAFYRKDCSVEILSTRPDTEKAFRTLFSPPFHPVAFDDLAATIQFHELPKQGSRTLPEHDLMLSWTQVPHPQGCAAYRLDDGDNAIVFATDVELGKSEFIGGLQALLTNPMPAGLAVIDGFYAPEEIGLFANWGHSTWREALTLATANKVETVVVTHHHPAKTDDELEALARSGHPAIWARERQTWMLEGNRAALLT